MDNLPYVDMSAANLRLTLLSGSVEPSLFHVLETGTVKSGDMEAEVRIIGASHWATLRAGALCVHELFSCHRTQDGQALAQYGPLGQASGPVNLTLFSALDYSFRVRTVSLRSRDLEAGEIRDSALQAEKRDGHVGLIHAFPGPEGMPAPQTIVWACLEPGMFNMATIHSYPNEDSLVITRTRILADRCGKAS